MKLNQLFALDEAARKRAALASQRYSQLNATYAAWVYYNRLDKAIAPDTHSINGEAGEEEKIKLNLSCELEMPRRVCAMLEFHLSCLF